MAICLSHAGTASYSSNSPSDKLLIGTGNGVYKGGVLASADSGRSWERWDQSLTEKDVCSL